MKGLSMLEEYSPLEARKTAELRFLDWLFLIQQAAAIILIISKFINPSNIRNIDYGLELFSQKVQGPLLLAILLAFHAGIFFVVLLVKKPFARTLILSFLLLMILYSLGELLFGNTSLFNIGGIVITLLWGFYVISSKRLKVRYFYNGYFEKARHTIVCPRCNKEVILDSESCGDVLSDEERLKALQARITDVINVPSWVRVNQIELIEARFGQKAVPFLKELYQKELKSIAPNVQIASTLLKTLSKYSEPSPSSLSSSSSPSSEPASRLSLKTSTRFKSTKPSSKSPKTAKTGVKKKSSGKKTAARKNPRKASK